MRISRYFRRIILSSVAPALIAFTWSQASAAPITGCNATTNVDNYLDADITYDSSIEACVKVRDGKNFDFRGHTITCTETGTSTCGPAVLCDGNSPANSVIQDTYTGSNDSDLQHRNIIGPAATGVSDCGTVQKLKIVGAVTGISASGTNGKNYLKNVIAPATGGTGINVTLQDGTDNISDNRIDGGNFGIKIVGRSVATGPKIDHNVIRGFTRLGIENADSTYVRIENNAILEGGIYSSPISVLSPNATYVGNICESGGPCSCEADNLIPPINCF
jgi:hypothetical protein